MSELYKKITAFKDRYPMTVAWRLRQHCKVVELHMNPDEEILYAFAAQKNDNPLDIITSSVIALTNKRILIGQKRLVFGYFLKSITPDMFNDLTIKMGIIWGKVYIDTIKEFISLSNVQREALPEIETAITSFMMEEKKNYAKREEQTS